MVLFFRFIGFCLSFFGYRGIRFFGIIIGAIAFDLFNYKKNIILYNLGVVYKGSLTRDQKINLGRKSIINYATSILETLASTRLFKKAKVEFVNFDEIKKIQRINNNGIYAVGVHIGNPELLFYFLSKKIMKKIDFIAIVANLNKGIGEKIIQTSRSKYIRNINKMNKMEKGLSATDEIFELINQKGMVCFSIDHKRPPEEFLFFFGKQTLTNNSVARLFFKNTAPILPIVFTRTKPGYFKIEFFDQVVFDRNQTLSLQENITQLTQELNKVAEKIILKYPEEHWWWRNRWGV